MTSTSEDPQPGFNEGDKVRSVKNRSLLGTVMKGPFRQAGRWMYRVRWDDGSITQTPAKLLVSGSESGTLEELLREKAFGPKSREDFVRNFTLRKLLTPVDDTLYSLRASRTQILPHQFKPLVRFLESLHRRYLIADEVGLGKTIEAGIILSELRARRNLGGVLILCPNHLRDKWRSELEIRFDEPFDIVDRRSRIFTLLDDIERDGSEHRRLIVGHKTLAARPVLERIEEGAPAFDLVIVDEAHHFRNTATLARRILGEIAGAANQLLLLTATPIQTAADNLLSLLRLLDEASFRSRLLFEERLDVNQHLVRAQRELRRASDDPTDLKLSVAAATVSLERIPLSQSIRFGLDDGGRKQAVLDALEHLSNGEVTLSDVADCADQVRELNLLTPYITRTRKVDVQQTCVRKVETVRPEPDLKPAERAFYDAVVGWCRTTIERKHGENRVLFLSRNLERRLASSLPGFAARLLRGRQDPDSLLGEPPEDVIELATGLPRVDSKTGELLRLLRVLVEQTPDVKVLVFASFHDTLRHLSRVLRAQGIDFELIHGGVTMDPVNPDRDERGKAVRRFLTDPQCHVLLSSNIGGEGLDLQKASVVVNFDFPWNPAVVEQRIGRVDRFGQTAKVVRVLNFLLPNTVEEVIFDRLDARLHLFEQAIGDFGRILGRVVRDLSLSFFREDLSLEELQERAQHDAWRLETERQNLDVLLKREGEFVAYDEDFTDYLKDLDATGRTLRPSDLAEVCDGVLRQHFDKSWIRPTVAENKEGVLEVGIREGVFDLQIDFNLRAYLRSKLHTERSGALQRFLARVPEGTVKQVTFDGEVAEHNEQLLLLTPRHPFVRALVEFSRDGAEFHPIAALEIELEEEDPGLPGLMVLCEGWVILGAQERRYLAPVLIPQERDQIPRVARRLLRRLLDNGQSGRASLAPDGDCLGELLEAGSSFGLDYVNEIAIRIIEREENRIRPRVAEINERYRRRIFDAKERLRLGELDPDTPETRLRNLRDYPRRLEREREGKIEQISTIPEPDIGARPVGAAWIEPA